MKKNNKGSTLVMVIIMVTLIGILVSAILSTTMFNYQMKAMNLNTKNNFYSAEVALDEIKAGLQKDISYAFSTAYVEVMQQYYSTEESSRETNFMSKYMNQLRENLKNEESVMASQYSLDYLENYLDKTAYSDSTNTGAKISSTSPDLLVTSKGVILKNLSVTYLDNKNYTTTIKTDLVLQCPKINFTQSTTMPNILQYCLIANENLKATTTMTTTIKGNVYGGNKGMNFESCNVTFQPGSTVITKGAVQVKSGAQVTTQGKVTLWCNDVNVTSANVWLNGTTYVANDLTVNDKDGLASKVTMSNEYYGFGNEITAFSSESLSNKKDDIQANPANYSSAILINGRNVTMDLSGLKKLMLGGSAYIGNTKAYMGESLTVKSNQIAYLVPGECIGVDLSQSGMNPATKEYYEELQNKYATVAEMVDMNHKIKKYGNLSLTELGVNSIERYIPSTSEQVYFFMLFESAEKANTFYKTYYSKEENAQDQKKLNEYVKLYVNQIKMSSSSQIKYMLNGNVVTYNGGSTGYLEDTIEDGTKAYISDQQISYQDAYAAYCTKLMNRYYTLSETEKTRTVFDNLVEESTMLTELGANSSTIFVDEDNGAVAIAVDNQQSGASALTVSDVIGRESGTVYAIVATGDVIVDCDFSGLIIAKGSVTLEDNITITNNQEKVVQALMAKDGSGHQLFTYLKDSIAYLSLSTGESEEEISSSAFDLETLIHYENWSKE